MTRTTAAIFGVAGVSLSTASVGAFVYTFTLPYRLTSTQDRLLELAMPFQLLAAAFAVLIGVVARQCPGDSRGRKLGNASMTLGTVVLILVVLAGGHVHSRGWKPIALTAPNQSMQDNAAPVRSFHVVSQARRA